MHGLNHYDYSARHYDPARLQFTTRDPHSENYYSWSPYAYVANNPMRYIDTTGCDTVPSNEVWEYNLINYRSDGHSGLHEEAYYPVIQNGKMTYRLHKITSGENEGNYAAIKIDGEDADGNEIYEYQFLVGRDKVDDFRSGETTGSGYLRGAVKLAVDGGMDGRVDFIENAKTHLKNQYKDPLTIISAIGTRNPMNPKDWIPKISSRSVQQPITIMSKSRSWNQFLIERKGMYNTQNYGTYRNARTARSRDYNNWKNK